MSQATKGLRAILVGSDCPSRKTAASQGHEGQAGKRKVSTAVKSRSSSSQDWN